MASWKVDRTMAAWGVMFGVVATVAGLLFFSAITGGFIAEGFFLIVLSWVLVLFLFARFVHALRNRGGKKDDELE